MWMPRIACPECERPLEPAAVMPCACGCEHRCENGTWWFLTAERHRQASRCAAQYRTVRRGDGHHDVMRAWWGSLPTIPDARHPAVNEWRIRRESFEHLSDELCGTPGCRVLDLGAGSGWMSSRLAALGYSVVALDRFDDETDRDAMWRHVGPPFVTVRADFHALPFEPAQFDVVVFNASLHHAPEPERALAGAARMLGRGGVLAVMDSPMFESAADGEAMVVSQLARLAATHGIAAPVRSGIGYLSFETLANAAERLGLRACFIPSRGPLTWRVRRQLAPLRLRRAPAAFGLWIAR
jgi:SAM-dependent methyltransferase